MSQGAAARRRCCATWRGCSTRVPAARARRPSALPGARATVGAQLRPAAAVGRSSPRELDFADARSGDPPGDPALRAAHPARHARGRRARGRRSVLDTHNVIEFEIRGHLWAQPVPLEILLRTASTSRPARSRCATRRALCAPSTVRDHGSRACCATTTRSCATCARWAREFAREFPKIAARLGMEGMEVADPYVERLLEGFAFLAARVQLKLDAEFPRLSQRLLEMSTRTSWRRCRRCWWRASAPSPPIRTWCSGFAVPRGSALTSAARRAGRTRAASSAPRRR